MKIYMVRHGETNWNKEVRMQGISDVRLNEEGKYQATVTSGILNKINFDICYSSPLIRAYETANIILSGKDTKIIIDDLLIERNMGDYEGGAPYNSVEYWDYKKNLSDHNVESVRTILQRSDKFVEKLKEKHNDENILIVSHGAFIRALYHSINGYDEDTDLYNGFKMDNCEVVMLEIKK